MKRLTLIVFMSAMAFGATIHGQEKDIDANGFDDILWCVDGNNVDHTIGYRDSAGPTSESPIAGLPILSHVGWEAAGTGDFDNDGLAEVLWRLPGNAWGLGEYYLSFPLQNGTVPIVDFFLSRDEQVKGIGDFDGNGIDDILIRDQKSGHTIVKHVFANGTTQDTALAYQIPGSDFSIEAVGDFSGDGRVDILWRYWPSETLILFRHNDVSSIGASLVDFQIPASLRSAGSIDLNGDGFADTLWYVPGTSGHAIGVLMNDTAMIGVTYEFSQLQNAVPIVR